jgi:hypothetical protein
MQLSNILSDRHYNHQPSWQIVYEWENEIAEALHLTIARTPKNKLWGGLFKQNNHRLLNNRFTDYIDAFFTPSTFNSLYFELYTRRNKGFYNNRHVIPIIIDFWNTSSVERLQKNYRQCPGILVTSLEVLNYFKANQINDRLIHFPMSLPTQYALSNDAVFTKKFDIVLAGRTNPVLMDYLKAFELLHPEIEYLYQTIHNGSLYYTSNKNGIVGAFNTRASYLELIRSAKVSFYATPGMDGGEKRTGHFNPVTPRFFELLAAGCHVIARYPTNADTDYFELPSICKSINSYEDFSNQLQHALQSPQPIHRNATYLNKHYTSSRISIINEIHS